jgi:hypothetical protein
MTAGLELRLARLFERGRAFVVAFDHGLVMGPMKGSRGRGARGEPNC